jgi:hypothetical protein
MGHEGNSLDEGLALLISLSVIFVSITRLMVRDLRLKTVRLTIIARVRTGWE